jgi:voltage-gated potassium channel
MEWPLMAVALIFLVGYATPIAVPEIPTWMADLCEGLVWVTWAAFALDYLVRLILTPHRWVFFKTNLLDLAVVALPLLRPLRLVRLLALLSILNRTGSQQLRGKVVTYTAGATALLVIVGALAVTDAERGQPNANITSLGDGLWWTLTTITTVGYGDRYPVTPTGRLVAVALMVCGIALLGVVTATIASWLVQKVSDVTEKEEAATRAQVEHLTSEVAQLKSHLMIRESERSEPATPGTTTTQLPEPTPGAASAP